MLPQLIQSRLNSAYNSFFGNVDTNVQPVIGIVTQAVDEALIKANPEIA